MSDALTESALTFACRRVEDFAIVNGSRPKDERKESTRVWLDYVGVEEARLCQFEDWMDTFLGPGWDGVAMIGFAVGLLVNQFNHGNT